MDSLPDFVKLAEAYGGVGIRAQTPQELDEKIGEMLAVHDRPCIFDCVVDPSENCFPMIPSGEAHNAMILGDHIDDMGAIEVTEEGKMLV